MNIYETLNNVVKYIEEYLDKKIDYKILAHKVGLNNQTLQNIFTLITNIGLAEYIRNRRLVLAAEDLKRGEKVIDVALKYQYSSSVAFSRVFTKFHGIKPSLVKSKDIKTRNYSILNFNENNMDMSYRIEKKEAFSLYGVKKATTEEKISYDAPNFFALTQKKYKKVCGNIDYGMVLYEKRFKSDYLEYWCLYSKSFEGFTKYSFPVSKWLIFKSNSLKSRDIQYLIHSFYSNFLSKNKYKLRDLPELEFYIGDGTMEFMVPIE